MASASHLSSLTRASMSHGSFNKFHTSCSMNSLADAEQIPSVLSRNFDAQNISASLSALRGVANMRTYSAIIVAMMGALMFGIDQGNYGLVQDFSTFQDFWRGKAPSKDEWVQFTTWGGSLITLGAAAGCMFAGPVISSSCGRRLCISFGGATCFVGCLFASYFTWSSLSVYYVGRFVTGFGAGVCCFALPIYNSEVATPEIRGLLGSVFQFMVVLGGVFASVLLAMITDWRMGMLLPGVAGAVVAMAIWFCPESPRYVMDKQGYDAGVAVLRIVRAGDVELEARAMQEESQAGAAAGQMSFMDLFRTRGTRRRVIIACYLQIAQQLTGVNAFLSYMKQVFEAANIADEAINRVYPPGYGICFNLFMLAGCVLGLALIDSERGGRRKQLIFATIFMGPPLIIAGVAVLAGWAGWIPAAMIFLYGPAFQFAWGIVPWIYPSEIFYMKEKDKAMSLATFFVFMTNFLINYITPGLLDWNHGATFLIFGALNMTNLLFVLVFIKETKGVPLDEVPALFDTQASVAVRAPDMRASLA